MPAFAGMPGRSIEVSAVQPLNALLPRYLRVVTGAAVEPPVEPPSSSSSSLVPKPGVVPPMVEPPMVEPPIVEPPIVEPPIVEPPIVEPPSSESLVFYHCLNARVFLMPLRFGQHVSNYSRGLFHNPR